MREVKCVFPETPLLCALFYLKGPAPCCYWLAVTCLSAVVCLSLKAVLSRLVNRAVIVVRVRHCLSVLLYAGLSMFTCYRALLISGCTRLPMRITLHGGAWKMAKTGGEPNGFCLVFVVLENNFEKFLW